MKTLVFVLFGCILRPNVDAVETEVDIAKEGSCRGKEQAKDGAEVTVDYDGYLQNDKGTAGKKFTSTYSLDAPFSFTVGGKEVIPGLEQGLTGFCAGSELVLYIPSELAYGNQGAGDTIPAGAGLVFEVVIIDVKIVETEYEKNIRLEAKSREEEAKRREEELERRKAAELTAKEVYDQQLEEELERRRVADVKNKEIFEQQLAEESKRREEQAKQVEIQQESVRQELIRREEHQKLIDEELERRKVQQELVRLDLKAREEEAERRRIDQVAREKEKERVAEELLRREDEEVRRIKDQNARQHEQERRDNEEQLRAGGVKISDDEEEKINQARIFFMNRRTRIKQSNGK